MHELKDFRKWTWEELVSLTHNAPERILNLKSVEDAVALAKVASAAVSELSDRSDGEPLILTEFGLKAAALSRNPNLQGELSLRNFMIRWDEFLLPVDFDQGPFSESNREGLLRGRKLKNLLQACRPIEKLLTSRDERFTYWYEHIEELP